MYLDESEVEHSDGKKYFCMGGVIMEYNYHENELSTKLLNSKRKIWYDDEDYKNNILHELEINEAHEKHFANIKKYNKMFCIEANYVKAYKEMAFLLSDKNISIIGVSICVDNIEDYYNEKIVNNKFTICMQMIIENFCHFLVSNNSTGSICYEELQSKQNDSIRKNIIKYIVLEQCFTHIK